MKCFGFPTTEKVCELCLAVNTDTSMRCRQKRLDDDAYYKRMSEIKSKCEFVVTRYDDCYEYTTCNRHGTAYDRNAPYCEPCEDCNVQEKR